MTKSEWRDWSKKRIVQVEMRDYDIWLSQIDRLNSLMVINQFPSGAPGTIVGAYSPLTNEPDLVPLFSKLKNLDFALPVIQNSDLAFYRYKSNALHKSVLGNMEPIPTPSDLVAGEHLDFIFVPGLVFDRFGGRLGRGKGFYDRYLSGYRGLKFGVCFSAYLVDEPVPMESHDIRMDFILTDAGLQDCRILLPKQNGTSKSTHERTKQNE